MAKALQAVLLAVVVCFAMGATDASSRFNNLGHRLMCTCGCSQLLGECNHVGCPESGRERQELTTLIAQSKADQEILDWFSAKYGATALAAPSTKGFDLVAWIAPVAVFAAALLGTILLVRRWSGIRTGKAHTGGSGLLETEIADPEERERFAKIRRETGADGGF